MSRIIELLLIATLVLALPSYSQAPSQAKTSFDVVSIKPNDSNSGNSRTSLSRGRFFATNVTVKMLLQTGYRIQDFQVIGGPSWIENDRFDIEAKPEEGAIPVEQGP